MLSFYARAVAICAMIGAVACAPTMQTAAKDVTKGAAPTAVSETARALDEPQTRARIAHVMETPEMQLAIRDLAKAVTEGATQGLSDAQLASRTEQLSTGIAEIAALATRGAVDAALAEAAAPMSEKRIQEIAAAASDTAARSATRAVAAEIPDTLGPALAEALQKDVAPGMRALLEAPELRLALSQASFQVAREAVLGSNEALAELEQKKHKTGTLARVSGWLANGGWILLMGAMGLAALLLAITAILRTRHLHRA